MYLKNHPKPRRVFNGVFIIFASILVFQGCSSKGQRADESFVSPVSDPVWPIGQGPRMAVDAAHHNFHTIDGRYQAFADLLRLDGYQVRAFESKFSTTSLIDLDILVISNALAASNASFENWRLPTDPAFTADEVAAVIEWIEDGGSLLLIADHMPIPAAAALLAEALGLEFTNSYAVRENNSESRPPIVFKLEDKTLKPHPIMQGRNAKEHIRQVATFTGQAFRGEATPLLVFRSGIEAVYPEEAGKLEETNRRHSVQGWYQGAVLELGKGRAAVFGEAAMFSAQVSSKGSQMGMNAEIASQNPQFLLNVMHWLSRVFD